MEFDKPKDVKAVDCAFGGNMKELLPDYLLIPEEFRDFNSTNKFIKLQQEWFFKGLDRNKLVAKKGIDSHKAIKHLSAIQCSFEPKHEHKEAGVAWLMSLWFV